MRLTIFLSVFFLNSQYAQAHIGHVGELAGHGHWVAVGVIVTAAALATLLAKSGKKKEEIERDDEAEPEAEPAVQEA